MQVARRALPNIALALTLVLGVGLPTAAHASGLELIPRLDFLVLNFGVLLLLIYPVNRLLLQPVVRVLQEREARTRGAVARAEALAFDAGSAEESIGERLATAQTNAQSARARILGEAEAEERRLLGEVRDEAGRQVDTVRAAIAGELEAARTLLRDDARSLAREVAARVLGRDL